MYKFEYEIREFDTEHYSNKEIKESLNALGEDGFEAIHIEKVFGSHIRIFLMRKTPLALVTKA